MKQKVILVKGDVRIVEKLLNDGWTITTAFPHTSGVLLIFRKSV